MVTNAEDMKNLEEQLLEKTKNLEKQERSIIVLPFGSYHNNILLCVELMDFWLQLWDSPEKMAMFLGKALKDLTEEEIGTLRNENFDRVMTLLKWSLFVPTFSLVEYTMKTVLLSFPEHPAAEKVRKLVDKPIQLFKGGLPQ